MASWLMRIVSSPGKSSRNRWAICCGLHALAHCRFFRRPCPRPFQGTIGPQTAAPPEVATTPASRSCTYVGSAALTASFAGFGRRAARSACHCAVGAREARPPPRVAALRRSSREIVEAARPSRRATSRTPWPCARHSAISSRSANDRYRPASGVDEAASAAGGMPPASRNHRVPTAGDTPARRAASSLAKPAAIAAQNCRRSSRRATPGRPGERKTPRPARSERRFRVPIATPSSRCCDDHLILPNIPRWLSASAARKPASGPRWARSGTLTITPCARASLPPLNANCSSDAASPHRSRHGWLASASSRASIIQPGGPPPWGIARPFATNRRCKQTDSPPLPEPSTKTGQLHYITREAGGGAARYEIDEDAARIVRQIFTWVGHERLTLTAVCRRLLGNGIPSPTGRRHWSRAMIHTMLLNPAYAGQAIYG